MIFIVILYNFYLRIWLMIRLHQLPTEIMEMILLYWLARIQRLQHLLWPLPISLRLLFSLQR